GNNSHEDICASLELFAREVMPEFHAREPEHEQWKRAVLAGEIELPEIDIAAYNKRNSAAPTIAPSGASREAAAGGQRDGLPARRARAPRPRVGAAARAEPAPRDALDLGLRSVLSRGGAPGLRLGAPRRVRLPGAAGAARRRAAHRPRALDRRHERGVARTG